MFFWFVCFSRGVKLLSVDVVMCMIHVCCTVSYIVLLWLLPSRVQTGSETDRKTFQQL